MDTRNDDSGGSDSLDKSLERKCVVQDGTESDDSLEELDYLAGQLLGMVEPLGNIAKKQKTDDTPVLSSADAASAVVSGADVGVSGCTVDGAGSVGLLSHLAIAVGLGHDSDNTDANNVTQQQQQQNVRNFDIETKVAPHNTTTATATTITTTRKSTTDLEVEATTPANITIQTNASNSNSGSNINLLSASTDSAAVTAATAAAVAAAAAVTKSETKAFESKVKQISKNLKETTLAEHPTKKASLEDSSSSSSPSSSTSSDCDTLVPSSATQIDTTANINTNEQVLQEKDITLSTTTTATTTTDAVDAAQIDTETTGTVTATATATSIPTAVTESPAEPRTKKVRFHPDAKENDGGNRIVPKKKKKKLSTPSANEEDDDVTLTPAMQQKNHLDADEDMECDDEEAFEQEEQFDLAKTIAEVQDYLKAHPLTFVRPLDENGDGGLTNGFSDENCVEQMDESSDEEFVNDDMLPENGVQRILGKHIKNGRVEFLCRYVEKAGLFWETEESLGVQCPNMLNNYECNREKRQTRLMRHVAERQNMRQRYTDF